MTFLFLLLILLILTVNGLVISSLFNKTKNQILHLGCGMILGCLGFLLILEIGSYILKGPLAIQFMFWAYFVGCFLVARIKRIKLSDIIDFRLRNKWLLLIILIYSLLILNYSNNVEYSGDAELWFAIATSFARGNYPVVLPWQPNFLTGYHNGTYIIEGALSSLASVHIAAVHAVFSAFLVIAIFLFVIGLARKENKSILSLLPAIFGLILFGGPILLISGHSNFFSQLLNWFPSVSSLINNLDAYPQLLDFKGKGGDNPLSLLGLIIRNYHTFGLATFLVFLYFLYIFKWKNDYPRKYFVVGILFSLTQSIQESFIIELPLILFSLILDLFKLKFKQAIKILIIVFGWNLILLTVLQNPYRDSLFTPAQKYPRFKITIPGFVSKQNLPTDLFDNSSFYKYSSDKMIEIENPSFMYSKFALAEGEIKEFKNTTWYLPNLYFIILIILIGAIVAKSKVALLLGLSGLISIPLSIFIVNTFWWLNTSRFLHQAYQLTAFAWGFLLFKLITVKQRWKAFSFLIITLVIFGPQLIVTHAGLVKGAFYWQRMNNFFHPAFGNEFSIDSTIKTISQLIKPEEKIIFIDKDPLPGGSGITEHAYTYGLFTPISPPDIKVMHAESGPERYDASSTLDPSSINKLGVNYAFIFNEAISRFSTVRKQQITEIKYFEPVYTYPFGVLYRVSPAFKNLASDELTLEKITDLIPDGKKVYIDTFDVNEIRNGLILYLARRTKVIEYNYRESFRYIETILPVSSLCKTGQCKYNKLSDLRDIDYFFTKPGIDPSLIFGYPFNKIAETKQIVLWQRSN